MAVVLIKHMTHNLQDDHASLIGQLVAANAAGDARGNNANKQKS